MTKRIVEIIKETLDTYEGSQLNIDSDVAKKILAKDIADGLKDAAKLNDSLYLELY